MDLRQAFRDPWVWGQLGLLAIVLVLLPWAARTVEPSGVFGFIARASAGRRAPGAVPFVFGLLISIHAAVSLGRNLTPATTPVEHGELIRRGPYAWVRHPIYSGLILILWGLGWWTSNWRVGLVTGLLSWAYFDRKATVEERKLRTRYPAYPDYAVGVPKLFPRLWR
jgi:protein-S-isoprenylcysteine O-methyltransferase Ste14